MKSKNILFIALLMSSNLAFANSEVQRLLDGYVIAKADNAIPADEKIKEEPYTIQVASYINEKDAASHVEELKVQESTAFYFPSFVRGQVWFKVCVGHFSDPAEAEKYRKIFAKRMDEPITFVISMLDRPAKSDRAVASVADREVMPIPLPKEEKAEGPAPEVKLIPKSAPEKVHVVAKAEPKLSELVPTSKPFGTIEPSKATGDDGVHFYAVQIGAYPTEGMAKEQLAKIKSEGAETFVKEAVVDGKTWYRAYVGNFSTHQEAKAFHGEFTKKNPVDSFVRRVHK